MSGTVVRKWLPPAAFGVAAFVLCAIAPRHAAAQATPTPPPPPAAPSTEFGGLVDVYYDFYSTKQTGDAPYRNWDSRHNQFSLAMAEAWLNKAPTADSRVGFRVKLNFGPAMSTFINAAEPGGATFQNIEEAYASYLAPAGKGIQFDVGKFVTTAGAEVIETKDIWNNSHSLLFALAIPYYHSGIRVTYSPNDKVTLLAGVVNGWNNVVDNNTGKTTLGSVTLKPNAKVTLVENYIGGPETPLNATWRNLTDTVLTYTPDAKTSLMANYDYGKDGSVHWQGVAGYVKYQASPKVAFSPRFEYYDDHGGFTTGTVQKLKEGTATLELKANDSLLWRLEYRGDFSDQAVFRNSSGAAKKNQQSIGFGLLYSFTSKVQ